MYYVRWTGPCNLSWLDLSWGLVSSEVGSEVRCQMSDLSLCARARVYVCVCVRVRARARALHGYCLMGNNGRLQYLRFCLFKMYVNVVFAIRRLYSTVGFTLFREQRFIRIIYLFIIIIIIRDGTVSWV